MKDIKIRPVKLCDIPDILKIYEYYIINTAITFEYVVPTIEEFTGRVRQVMQRYPYLVAEVEGYIVGYAYANILKDRKAVNVNIRMYNFDDIKCTITLSFAYDDVIGKNLRIY